MIVENECLLGEEENLRRLGDAKKNLNREEEEMFLNCKNKNREQVMKNSS